MFENKTAFGIYYSRFIASWLLVGGEIKDIHPFDGKFNKWLRQLTFDDGQKLSDEQIYEICNMATNGKAELQWNARDFMNKK